jgi:DNA-binding protein
MDDSQNIKPSLEITYKEFVAVLRGWEAFVWPELKKMPEAVPAISPEESMYRQTDADVEVTSNVRLSELAEALWRSLEAGAKEVHRIHDETFAKEQVKFFANLYSSADKLIPVDGIYGMLRSRHPTVEHPMELFIKLGKPAQELIVRKDYLNKAVDVYERAKNSIAEKIREEREAEEERLREARERRAAPDYVRLILGTTRKRVRELDKDQCVFCGAEVGERHGKYVYVRLTPRGYKADEVVLSCKPCEANLEGRTPAEAGMTMGFGRFNKEV